MTTRTEEKARRLANAMASSLSIGLHESAIKIREIIEPAIRTALSAAKAEAREEEREACARLKCQMCNAGDLLEHGVPPGATDSRLIWFHRNPRGESPREVAWDQCRSALIRERGLALSTSEPGEPKEGV